MEHVRAVGLLSEECHERIAVMDGFRLDGDVTVVPGGTAHGVRVTAAAPGHVGTGMTPIDEP